MSKDWYKIAFADVMIVEEQKALKCTHLGIHLQIGKWSSKCIVVLRFNKTETSLCLLYCYFFLQILFHLPGWKTCLTSSLSQEVMKETRPRHLINLMYLANDVIQNSRRQCPKFMDVFYDVLEPAFKYVLHLSRENDAYSWKRMSHEVMSLSQPGNQVIWYLEWLVSIVIHQML